jgi:hypothetical protein
MCYSVWLLYVFLYIERVGMLVLMTPRRAEMLNHATEKLILIFTSHFAAEVNHIHTTYLVNINVL